MGQSRTFGDIQSRNMIWACTLLKGQIDLLYNRTFRKWEIDIFSMFQIIKRSNLMGHLHSHRYFHGYK